jgi:hypothetical protein
MLLVILLALGLSDCDEQHSRVGQTPPRTSDSPSMAGCVIDSVSHTPVPNAIITLDGTNVMQADEKGQFPVTWDVNRIGARAVGYTRAESEFSMVIPGQPVDLYLKPLKPKALYLTVFGAGDRTIRNRVLDLIDKTELNALVIDMKGDRGFIPYKSDIPMASAIGAQKLRTLKDIRGFVQSLKERGIYTIARIVVFKDNLLGTARPDLAIHTPDGQVWHDREDLIWVDPTRKEVWEYNIDIALEAARNGFDEIQFDYVRFPDTKGLTFSIETSESIRVGCIERFLTEARQRLLPYNVFLAADIFGYVTWNIGDMQIGQRIDRLAPAVDYISLMLYPSGFRLGIPGYKNPVENSNRIVYLSLKNAQNRSSLPSVHFRPWLQAFRDYAFDKRQFTGIEIREQIKAAEEFGSNGWMLWNPRNVYSSDGLKDHKEIAQIQCIQEKQSFRLSSPF